MSRSSSVAKPMRSGRLRHVLHGHQHIHHLVEERLARGGAARRAEVGVPAAGGRAGEGDEHVDAQAVLPLAACVSARSNGSRRRLPWSTLMILVAAMRLCIDRLDDRNPTHPSVDRINCMGRGRSSIDSSLPTDPTTVTGAAEHREIGQRAVGDRRPKRPCRLVVVRASSKQHQASKRDSRHTRAEAAAESSWQM